MTNDSSKAALAGQRQAEVASGDKYRAELYDEVWQKARDMGYGNVTEALTALERQQPAATCRTCGGSGYVDDGEIYCYEGGMPYENGPVQCVKDCPACTVPPARQVGGAQQKPVAIVTVEHSGYSIRVSEHVAYALPEGSHELFPYPSLAPAATGVILPGRVEPDPTSNQTDYQYGHDVGAAHMWEEVARLNRNPIPMELLEKAAHWLEVHAPGAGSIEQDIADEIRAVTSKDDEVIVKDQLKPVAIVRSRYGDPEAFGERWLEVISDIQAMPYGAKLYAIPEGFIKLLKRIAQMPSSPEAEMDRYEACDELRSLLAQQSHAAILTQRGQEGRN